MYSDNQEHEKIAVVVGDRDKSLRQLMLDSILEKLPRLSIGDVITYDELQEWTGIKDRAYVQASFKILASHIEVTKSVFFKIVRGVGYRRVDEPTAVTDCKNQITKGVTLVNTGVQRTHFIDRKKLNTEQNTWVSNVQSLAGRLKLIETTS